MSEIGQELCVPTRLIQQIMQTLAGARLVVEVAGAEAAYCPARPLETRVVVVDIDMKSLAEIGPWPWPRSFGSISSAKAMKYAKC